jgi:predicted RNA binding protein YcfA (HicA-like mRNA interferase family)
MSSVHKTLDRIKAGSADATIRFDELRAALKTIGFVERIKGSHHIFTKADVAEIINLQPSRDKQNAKAYQVRQVRNVLAKYKLYEG